MLAPSQPLCQHAVAEGLPRTMTVDPGHGAGSLVRMQGILQLRHVFAESVNSFPVR